MAIDTIDLSEFGTDADRLLFDIEKAQAEDSLSEFIKQAWEVIEPGQPYVHGWHIDFLCEHLEAITYGLEREDGSTYNRLLINIPPGTMKSLTVNVFWPAWEWGPQDMAHLRYVCASHSQELAIRDSTKMRRLIESEWYQERWGDRVKLTRDQNQKTKFENDKTGFRQAVAAGSITGARGDRVIIDDPHSVEGAASDQQRQSTIEWFLEAVPTRLNNPKESAIVVVMQRLHEGDVSGIIIDKNLNYDHIMLPMRYDPSRAASTELGLEDPRTEEGELLFPARFPEDVVDRDERVMGTYATAGQFQQSPTPRGGGVIKTEWWQLWDREAYPPFDYVVASLDTAFTTKQENDPSAMTVWGIWSGGDQTAQITRVPTSDGEMMTLLNRTYTEEHPKAMLMYAWAERLELHDLVIKVQETMDRYSVDKLLVENKASGPSVAQELQRLYSHEDFAVQLIDPKGLDKLARLYSVQHFFAEGLIYAPDRSWADMVITQVSQFPKAKHDDLCFVAGTMIEMADGSLKAIESIIAGDAVSTPFGGAVVSAAGMTSNFAETWRVDFDKGWIEGTKNHPIMSNGKWMPLHCLSAGDMLELSYPNNGMTSWFSKVINWLRWKAFISTDTNIIDTRNQKIRRIEDILRVQGLAFIGMCGNTITALSQMVSRFITLTAIRSTMPLQTLNVCHSKSIEKSMSMNILKEANQRSELSIFEKLGMLHLPGIRAKKDELGIENTQKIQLRNQAQQSRIAKALTQGSVNGVAHYLPLCLLEKFYAAICALVPNQNTCLVKAVMCTNTSKQVYNLTVDGAHCYYANGILVHNCDTVSMAISYMRRSGLLVRNAEWTADLDQSRLHVGGQEEPLYPV
jgi:predicted phage terminase large subunit-like protein